MVILAVEAMEEAMYGSPSGAVTDDDGHGVRSQGRDS
jgi:hypothetical protein